MLVYGECECFVMQMLYVCVLCTSCGSKWVSGPMIVRAELSTMSGCKVC